MANGRTSNFLHCTSESSVAKNVVDAVLLEKDLIFEKQHVLRLSVATFLSPFLLHQLDIW